MAGSTGERRGQSSRWYRLLGCLPLVWLLVMPGHPGGARFGGGAVLAVAGRGEDAGTPPPVAEQVLPVAPAAEEPPAAPPPAWRPPPQVVRHGAAAPRQVALTFDDGPYPRWTERYLAVLRAQDTPATFFLVGQRARRYPEETQAIAAAGHEVGSHSASHTRLAGRPNEEIARDLYRTARDLQQLAGREVRLFRPPYGDYTEAVVEVARALGQATVTWEVDPRDWENPPAEKIAARVLDRVRPGSIVILHEGRANTLAALPEIIRALRERGYALVTVSQLLLAPAVAASSR